MQPSDLTVAADIITSIVLTHRTLVKHLPQLLEGRTGANEKGHPRGGLSWFRRVFAYAARRRRQMKPANPSDPTKSRAMLLGSGTKWASQPMTSIA